MEKYTIIDILQAPLIDCLVKDKLTENVLYHGDSSYMANQAYRMALRNDMKPVYDKKITLLVPEKNRPSCIYGDKGLLLYRELMQKVPERIRHIYANTVAGKKVEAATVDLARQFHPEYFAIQK